MKSYLWYSAFHRGALCDCIDTETPIDCDLAYRLIKAKIYLFYSFDKRINAYRFLIYDVRISTFPQWLHYYGTILPKLLNVRCCNE